MLCLSAVMRTMAASAIIALLAPVCGIAGPAQVLNIEHLPAVRGQLLASCGAYAPTYYYKTYQEAREHGWIRPDPEVNPERVMSPGFTFPLVSGGDNWGASIGGTMEVICRFGVADWATMPETADFITFPTEAAWRNAIPRRGDHVAEIDVSTSEGLAALKEHLAGGDLAIIGFTNYHDVHDVYPFGVGTSQEVIYDKGVDAHIVHAYTLIGYDDNKEYLVDGQTRKGAFAAVNSWGPGWGVEVPGAGSGGFVWFSYDYTLSNRNGGPLTMVDRVGYQPTDFAVVRMGIGQRANLSMGIMAGSPTNPLGTAQWAFPNISGLEPYGGTLVLDVTDFASLNPVCYTLSAYDISHEFGTPAGTVTGVIEELTITRPGGITIRSAATHENPVSIIAGKTVKAHAGPLLPVGTEFFDQALAETSTRFAMADWNRDGAPDFAAAGKLDGSTRNVGLFRNQNGQAGDFALTPTIIDDLNVTSLAWADYNGDGLPDLAATGSRADYTTSLMIYRSTGTGLEDSGIALEGLSPGAIAWGDYNNDGRPDLAAVGTNSGGVNVGRLYRNDGGSLLNSGVSLPAGNNVAISWADVDNDGWLDLAIGHTLLRNNGDGSFTEAFTFEAGLDSVHAWGDYDGDGRVDLAYCVQNPSAEEQRVRTSIWHNDGDFAFHDINAVLPGVRWGALAWGDVNVDGRLDLAVSGFTSETLFESTGASLLLQGADGVFRNMGFDLPGLGHGSLEWVDLNVDGWPDLMTSGSGPWDEVNRVFPGTSALWLNHWAEMGATTAVNLPPPQPANLRATWNESAGEVTLQWNPSISVAGGKGSFYRVRMGTRPGAADVICPFTTSGPQREYAGGVHSPGHASRILRGLEDGWYYWSVQAVDTGLAASEWSREEVFVLGSAGIAKGDANQDGRLDAADTVMAQRMTGGQATARPEFADVSGNGVVDALDAWQIAQNTIGNPRASSPGEGLTIAEATIGMEGGTVTSSEYGIEVRIPPGCLPRTVKVTLKAAPGAGACDADAVPLSWSIHGLPNDFLLPIDLRLRDIRPSTTPQAFAAIGLPAYGTDGIPGETHFVYRAGTKLGNGWVSFIFPALGSTTPVEQAAIQEVGSSRASEFAPVVNLLTEDLMQVSGKIASSRFRITGPPTYANEMLDLVKDFEDAWELYITTLKYDVSGRDFEAYPLEVIVKDLSKANNGEPVDAYTISFLRYRGIYIEINQGLLKDEEQRRTLVGHEFFHVVQKFYKMFPPIYWLDEATSSYMEVAFAQDPATYVSVDTNNDWRRMYEGFHRAEASGTRASYGYGMANMARHMVNSNGGDKTIIRTVYEKIKAGQDALAAVRLNYPGTSQHTSHTWMALLLRDHMQQELFPMSRTRPELVSMFERFNTPFRSDSKPTLSRVDERVWASPEMSLPMMAARGSSISFAQPLIGSLTAEDKIGFELTGAPATFDVRLMTFNTADFSFTDIGPLPYDLTRNTWRSVLNNAPTYIGDTKRLVAIVANVDSSPISSLEAEKAKLYFGIFRDYPNLAITAHPLNPIAVEWSGQDLGWPKLTASGQFAGKDIASITEHYKTRPADSLQIPTITIKTWGRPFVEPDVAYAATVDEQSVTRVISDDIYGTVTISLSATGPIQYRLRKWRFTEPVPYDYVEEHVADWPWGEVASYGLGVTEEEKIVSYGIQASIPYHLRAVDSEGAVLEDRNSTMQSTGFYFYIFAP